MTDKKVAIVTGASRGIGASCATKLGKLGYRVMVHYRSNEEGAKKVCDEIGDAVPISVELNDPQGASELIKQTKEHFGRIDVLVNNAGVSIDSLIPFAKVDDFDFLLNVNLKPVFLLSKLAAKQMIRQKSGNIINMTSVIGFTGNAGQTMYAATKSAIIGLTKSAAKELAAFGIRVNCVAPGLIQTDMTDSLPKEATGKMLEQIPMKRWGKPSEVANCVAFLASDESSYVTGTALHVNGGMY